MRDISYHIMPLVINSLGRGHTHTHTDNPHRVNFKKQGVRRLPGLKTDKVNTWSQYVTILRNTVAIHWWKYHVFMKIQKYISNYLHPVSLLYTAVIDFYLLVNWLLNQASAWFLKIDPVRIVGMCVCVRARGY